jgi:hypothetical protein
VSDPAVEAAQRALDDMPMLGESCATQTVLKALVLETGADAAREALKPVRELHYAVQWTNRRRCCVHCSDSSGSPVEWPCATARLVYTSEELGCG